MLAARNRIVRYSLDLQVTWECNPHVGSVELFCSSAAYEVTEIAPTGTVRVWAVSSVYAQRLLWIADWKSRGDSIIPRGYV
jgi:hypothetical protein